MLPNTNLTFGLNEIPREREEMFPMQEQDQGPVCCGTEKTASAIFTERLKESSAADSAPIFIP